MDEDKKERQRRIVKGVLGTVGVSHHPPSRPPNVNHSPAAAPEVPKLMAELRASYSALRDHALEDGPGRIKTDLKAIAPGLATFLATPASHEKTSAPTANLGVTPKAPAAKMPTLKAGPAPKVTGQLRLSATAANATPVGQLKPKTTPPHPGSREGNFPGIAAAKPPSLTGFYRDSLDSMSAPTRGTRT